MSSYDIVDPQTGEILTHSLFAHTAKRHNGFQKGHLAMAQPAAAFLRDHARELGVSGFAVLMDIISNVQFDNAILLNQREMARRLKMHQPHVSSALKRLAQIGVLIEGPKAGVHRTYRLNAEIGWKGSAKSHHIALADKMKAKGLTVIQCDGHQIDLEDAIAAQAPETA